MMGERQTRPWAAWPLALLGAIAAVALAASVDPHPKTKGHKKPADTGHKDSGWIGGHKVKGGWIKSDRRDHEHRHDRRFRTWPGRAPRHSWRFGKRPPVPRTRRAVPPADRGYAPSDEAAGNPEIVREMWEQTTLEDVRGLFHRRYRDDFDELLGRDAAVWHDVDERGRPGERARFAAHVLTMLHAMAVQRRAARLFGGPDPRRAAHGNPWGGFWILGPEDQDALHRSAEGEEGGPPTPRYLRGLLRGARRHSRQR
jgi:hypothetical protein